MSRFRPGKKLKSSQGQIHVPAHQLELLIERKVAERLPVLVEQQLVHTSYSGPMPLADESTRYEQICPGFTDRWVKMSEREQDERIKTIKRRDWMDIGYKLASLVIGGLAVLSLVAGGIWLISTGKSMEGFGSIGVAGAALWGAAHLKKPKEPATEKRD